MVSAGESVEVTLPRNDIELNAFVVPTPPNGKTMEILDKLLQFITLKLPRNMLHTVHHVISAVF